MTTLIVTIDKFEPPGQTAIDNGFSGAISCVQITPLDPGYTEQTKDKWFGVLIPESKIASDYGNILGKEKVYAILISSEFFIDPISAFITEIIGPVTVEMASETDVDRAKKHQQGQRNYNAAM